MGWMKRSKPAPAELGTTHLDTVTVPDVYVQPFASRATRANGYPFEGVAGTLKVIPWNPSNGNVIAYYHTWDRGDAKRVYYLGSWRAWTDLFGKAVP